MPRILFNVAPAMEIETARLRQHAMETGPKTKNGFRRRCEMDEDKMESLEQELASSDAASGTLSKAELEQRKRQYGRTMNRRTSTEKPQVESPELIEKKKEYDGIGLEKYTGFRRQLMRALYAVTRMTPEKIMAKDLQKIAEKRATDKKLLSDTRHLIKDNQKTLGNTKGDIVVLEQKIAECEELYTLNQAKLEELNEQIRGLDGMEGDQLTPLIEEYASGLAKRKRLSEADKKTKLLQEMVAYRTKIEHDMSDLEDDKDEYMRGLEKAADDHVELENQIEDDRNLVGYINSTLSTHEGLESKSSPRNIKKIDARGLSNILKESAEYTKLVVSRRAKAKEYEQTERAEIDSALEDLHDLGIDYSFDVERQNKEIDAERKEESEQHLQEVRQKARSMIYR